MKELDIAFNLLKSALDAQPPYLGTQPIGADVWWKLFRMMQRNRIAALASEAINLLPDDQRPPRDVLIPWLSEREQAVTHHRHQEEVTHEIMALMQSHGIDTLVLKGIHVSEYYPKPELREFGDIDLYFYNRHNEADRIASIKLGVTVKNDSHHHTRYNFRSVTVESHYDFVNVHYPRSNRRYEKLLKELAGAKQVSSTTQYQLPTFEVLFLLRHMACHFAAGRITLRDLCDWALTCKALQAQVDWETVRRTIIDFGMEPFARALCSITETRLGIVVPLSFSASPDTTIEAHLVENDMAYGSPATDEYDNENLGRLVWKIRRFRANRWKQRMVYSDSSTSLLLSSLISHAEKPAGILHKM